MKPEDADVDGVADGSPSKIDSEHEEERPEGDPADPRSALRVIE